MDRDDTPLLEDDDSRSETESSLSDLAFDNFSSALVGGATVPTVSPDTQQTDAKAQNNSVSVTLPDVEGQFDSQDDGASASAQWHGRSVVVTMVFLMMLSSAQLIVGIIYSFLFVGIPPLVTAVLGLLVSSGHMLGYIPGGHLEKQVKVVLTASAIALGINAFSLVMYSVTFFAVLALVRAEWEIDAVLIIVYLMFWAQTLVFLRVGSQAQSVLRMLHPQRT